MKDTISKLITPLFAVLAGAGSFLVSKGIIAAEYGPAIDEAGASAAAVLVGLVALIAAAVIGGVVRKFFGNRGDGGGSGGPLSLIALVGTAVGFGFSLPSCSTADFPIRVGLRTPHADVDYSTETGVVVRGVIPASGK